VQTFVCKEVGSSKSKLPNTLLLPMIFTEKSLQNKVFERFLHWVMPLEQGIPGVITPWLASGRNLLWESPTPHVVPYVQNIK
jgi:hypothetical protein